MVYLSPIDFGSLSVSLHSRGVTDLSYYDVDHSQYVDVVHRISSRHSLLQSTR